MVTSVAGFLSFSEKNETKQTHLPPESDMLSVNQTAKKADSPYYAIVTDSALVISSLADARPQVLSRLCPKHVRRRL